MSAEFSESAESSDTRDFRYWRLRFRAWRGTRPFWAGLLTIIGGVPIMYFPYANLHLGSVTIAMATTAGAGSLIIGVLLVTLGLTQWFHSIVRVFSGVATILLALVSLPVSNFGGFVVGYLMALLGGALALAWAPGQLPVPGPAVEEGRDTEAGADLATGAYATTEGSESEVHAEAAAEPDAHADADDDGDRDGKQAVGPTIDAKGWRTSAG